MNKSILFTSPGVAELIDCDIPTVGDDEVLVKLERSSISAGTERANLTEGVRVSYGEQPTPWPRHCGYSASGVVCEVGALVKKIKVGDRVACSGSCHAQYCALKEKRVHLLPDSVSFAAAALVYIGTFPLAAIRKCGLEMGEAAIVMGQGVLGMMAVKLLRAAGASPIVAVDPVASKRELALKLGADAVLDPFERDFAKKAKEITEGGAHVAIEVTGLGQGLDQVLDCMRRHGRVALLGCTRDADFTIDYYRKVHGPGITLVGAHTTARPKQDSSHGWWTDADDAHALIRLCATGRFDLGELVEDVFSPVEAPAVYRRLVTDRSFPVVQFDWRLL